MIPVTVQAVTNRAVMVGNEEKEKVTLVQIVIPGMIRVEGIVVKDGDMVVVVDDGGYKFRSRISFVLY